MDGKVRETEADLEVGPPALCGLHRVGLCSGAIGLRGLVVLVLVLHMLC
jgi:hypothetical protein